jgi:hypothetical protein
MIFAAAVGKSHTWYSSIFTAAESLASAAVLVS